MEALLAAAERLLPLIAVDYGFIGGWDAADGKFGSRILDAAAVQFACGSGESLAPEVYAGRIQSLFHHRIIL